MEKGDDELAKEALKRRKSNQENADTMKSQLDQQRKAVDQLISNTKCAGLPTLLLTVTSLATGIQVAGQMCGHHAWVLFVRTA